MRQRNRVVLVRSKRCELHALQSEAALQRRDPPRTHRIGHLDYHFVRNEPCFAGRRCAARTAPRCASRRGASRADVPADVGMVDRIVDLSVIDEAAVFRRRFLARQIVDDGRADGDADAKSGAEAPATVMIAAIAATAVRRAGVRGTVRRRRSYVRHPAIAVSIFLRGSARWCGQAQRRYPRDQQQSIELHRHGSTLRVSASRR